MNNLNQPVFTMEKKLSRERDEWRIYDAITSWIIYVISSVSAKILNKSLVQQLKITMAMTISMTNKQNVKSRKTGGLPPYPRKISNLFHWRRTINEKNTLIPSGKKLTLEPLSILKEISGSVHGHIIAIRTEWASVPKGFNHCYTVFAINNNLM